MENYLKVFTDILELLITSMKIRDDKSDATQALTCNISEALVQNGLQDIKISTSLATGTVVFAYCEASTLGTGTFGCGAISLATAGYVFYSINTWNLQSEGAIKTTCDSIFEKLKSENNYNENSLSDTGYELNSFYTVKSGDSLWAIAQKHNKTLDELLSANPWLADRTNADKSFVLIKPGDLLTIPGEGEFAPGDWLPDMEPVIPPSLNPVINSAQFCYNNSVHTRLDPLVIDLDGGGIETIAITNSNAYFDLDGDGIAERVGWISPNNGILVVDGNNNGQIDGISELFGSPEITGFEEMKTNDTNNDNIIDANDEIFNQIKVWRDIDGNGIAESYEVNTLSDLGITSINLNPASVNQLNNENLISEVSTFTYSDGRTQTAADVNLLINQINSVTTGPIVLDASIIGLPLLKGYGDVKDLSIAMSENPELKDFVSEMTNLTDLSEVCSAMDELLAKWAGVDDVDINAGRGPYYNDRKLSILEKFMGEVYKYYPPGSTDEFSTEVPLISEVIGNIDMSYKKLRDLMFAHFVAQSQLAGSFSEAQYDLASDKIIFPSDISSAVNSIAEQMNSQTDIGKDYMSLILKTLSDEGNMPYTLFEGKIDQKHYDILNGSVQVFIGMSFADALKGWEGDDTLYGGKGNDSIDVGAGQDTVYCGDGNDYVWSYHANSSWRYYTGSMTIYGEAGDDILNCGPGNDLLVGGTGNDELMGGSGDDVYVFNIGDGLDKIRESYGNDTIRFGEGITLDDLNFSVNGASLEITYKNSTDKIELYEYFVKDYWDTRLSRIENFEFADGTVLTSDELESTFSTHGTSGNDTISGSNFGDRIYGESGDDNLQGNGGDDMLYGGEGNDFIDVGDGNDTVYCGDGNDYVWSYHTNSLWRYYTGSMTIYGEAGDDILNCGPGNDLLVGGTGNDELMGGSGDDVYVFNIGDGLDKIRESYGNDTIRFGEGITLDDLNFSVNGASLEITYKNSTDKIELYEYFVKDYWDTRLSRIENFEFADGTVLTSDELESTFSTHGTSGNDTISGSNFGDRIYGESGDDNLQGNGGDDMLYGGEGNDFIDVGDGNDTVYCGDGNDYVWSYHTNSLWRYYTGSMTIYGEAGDDILNCGSGNDILNGGTGNDELIGGSGDDVYVFNIGDGQDKIRENYGTDTIRFGEGITLDNLSFEKQNLDLLVKIKDPVNGLSNDQIIVQYQYESSANYRIETFEFANGSSISCDDVESIITYGKIIKQGTDEADTIFGSTTNEDIYGNGGNDSLYAGGGTDNIYGGEGDDTLYGDDGDDFLYGENGSDDLEGGYGNDILTGGTGDDLLGGGSDNDTYIFNRGDGQDTIFDSDSEGFSWFDAGADDKIVFGEGITQNDLVITKSVSDYDVLITLKDADGNLTQDSILITNQLVAENKIEKLEFADGSSLTSADIESLFAVIEGSDSDDSLIGTGGDDVIDGGSGADIMAGGGGDDVYYVDNNGDIVTENSGEGTDEIISGVSYTLPENVENLTMNGVDNINANGNSGSNTILGNSGDNSINGHKDNDNLIGNGGDDKIDGGLGDDLLIGEVGNDDLNGGGGNDVYVFEKGDNIDTVKDTGGDDVIKFGSSVDKTNIAMFKDNAGNLYLDYGETGNADVIKVKNWNSASGQIEKIQLSDNSYITNTDVNLILQDMTAYAAANGISLTSVNAVKANAGLMNIIAMSWHS